ncbi:hypothetical protein EXIGLDRAFT_713376 [Exidia glandulosa HHB12029]|uniref:26S proteasome regulatory subunit Rpn7 N-terminal domain-containing protein n=1 Tax=Exidia glandulosa HHB12029 TaxID=1314781 RepID=A0A166B532_EXIGL|nr:hypothetical protein EXIGLDRAFT_713376 [Exidia glandulosa HHB12029]
MAPWYKHIASTTPTLQLDSALLDKMEAQNKTELDALDARLAEAEKTEGETEISDALRARATYLTRIGDKENAVKAQELALSKTPGLGSRIDIVLTLTRIGFFFADHALITENLTRRKSTLIEEGGDWDRRNRLKVYQGLHMLSIRSCSEYNDFVTLCVIVNTLTLKHVDLKKRSLLVAPEVTQVLLEVTDLADYTKSLYECHYDKFFVALATLEQKFLMPSRLLRAHARYYVREMRILAYAQLLESYRSLTLESMARPPQSAAANSSSSPRSQSPATTPTTLGHQRKPSGLSAVSNAAVAVRPGAAAAAPRLGMSLCQS